MEDDLEEKIKDALGTEEMLKAICKALNYDTKADIYHYEDGGSDVAECGDILRLYDGKYKRRKL